MVANPADWGQFKIDEFYEQGFNTLPKQGAIAWINDGTIPGWYLQQDQIAALDVAPRPGKLYSIGRDGSNFRALGGIAHRDTPLVVGLRFINLSEDVISGIRVAYEVKWFARAEAKSSIELAYCITDTSNTTWDKVLSNDWTTVQSDVIDHSSTKKIPDSWSAYLTPITDLGLSPHKELWLAWRIKSIAGAAPVGIDNVRVGDCGIGDPAVMLDPLSLNVQDTGTDTATFRVVASGTGRLHYQWHKDGAPIADATEASYSIPGAGRAHVGEYSVSIRNVRGKASSRPAFLSAYSASEVVVDKDVEFLPKSRREFADLYRPSPSPLRPMPAVLVIHGGGGNDGDKAKERESLAAREFAKRGYLAMSINYQRSRKLADGSWLPAWPQNIRDAKAAVRWLRKNASHYNIDPHRIGAIGFSWGGNMASMLAATRPQDQLEPVEYPEYSSEIQCAANFYAANEIVNYHDMKQFGGPTIDSDTDLYKRASPGSYAHRNAAPTLLSHGLLDTDVLVTQSIHVYDHMRRSGAVAALHIVPNGNHSYRLGVNRGKGGAFDVAPETFGFFQRHLMHPSHLITSQSGPSD